MADHPDDNNQTRFARFVVAHRGSLHRHVRTVYPHVDADSIVNGAFAVAWQHFDDITPDEAPTWLRVKARLLVLNHDRQHRRQRALTSKIHQLDPHPVHVEPPDDHSRTQLDVVLRALTTLSANDQQLLRLAAVDELSVAEIAEILDASPNAVKVRLFRARARLREAAEQLDDEGSGVDP